MKPEIATITEDLARPFIASYCKTWGIKHDPDSSLDYGKAVLWVGAWYKGALRGVAGLLAAEELPGELFVYGLYGDGTKYEYRPLRGLLEFIHRLNYKHKYGNILLNNVRMQRAARKFGWIVEDRGYSDLDGNRTVVAETV